MQAPVILRSDVAGLQPTRRGKVRDIYELDDALLLVATDRLSAFDVILPDGIPSKGRVLTQISAFWFHRLARVIPHHLISTSIREFPEPFRSHPEVFADRSMLVGKTRPLPVECVARGYLAGSAWNDYKTTGGVCGVKLPPGLRESDRLPEPIFTPSTKAAQGVHDENISFADVERIVGSELAGKLRDVTLQLYTEGATYAASRGIIIADTKFEFGLGSSGNLVWIDEALTPDSSRFWPAQDYRPGGPQPSFDKQYVRDYLLSIHWRKTPPGPDLPGDVIRTTSDKYREALRLLTGTDIA